MLLAHREASSRLVTPDPASGLKESTSVMNLRAAEEYLYKCAHEDAIVFLGNRPTGDLPEPSAPNAKSREMWLHWLQRHAPHDTECNALAASQKPKPHRVHVTLPLTLWLDVTHRSSLVASSARAQALVSLMRADPRSERGFDELCFLVPVLHEREASQSLGSSTAAPMGEDIQDAMAALPLHEVLILAASRVEVVHREERAWALFCVVLQYMLATADDDDILLHFAARWWGGNADWWPEACFEVYLACCSPSQEALHRLDSANEEELATEKRLWLLRLRCMRLLAMVQLRVDRAGIVTAETQVATNELRVTLETIASVLGLDSHAASASGSSRGGVAMLAMGQNVPSIM